MPATFAEIVEAADRLTVDEQEMLVQIVQRRLLEYRRERLIREVEEAEAEYARGEGKAMSVEEFMREIRS